MTTLVAMIQVDDANPSKLVFTPKDSLHHREDNYVVRDRKGFLGSTHDFKPLLQNSPSAGEFFSFMSQGQHFRGRLTRHIPIIDPDSGNSNETAPRVDVWYAVPMGSFDKTSRKIVWITLLVSLFWITSSCLIAWFSVTRGMLPLGELAQQASEITERKWVFSVSDEVREISETRPLVLSLEELVARLGAAFKRERTFVSDAAHELKTAVAIQKSSLQVALQGKSAASCYRNGLERALEDVDRLQALVHRMLSLASIEGSSQPRDIEWVALDETILEACDQMDPVARASRLTLKTHFTGRYYVASEEGLLQTLWGTLIENAIRYSPPDSVIKLECSLRDHWATVVVEDHGAGIQAEDLPHIFERFYRGDTSRSRNTGGFGLGLAIAKAIVERHNGEIELKSERGVGTVIRISLPCA